MTLRGTCVHGVIDKFRGTETAPYPLWRPHCSLS